MTKMKQLLIVILIILLSYYTQLSADAATIYNAPDGARTGAQMDADPTLAFPLDDGTHDYYATLASLLDWIELQDITFTGTLNLSGATVTFGLEASDIPDLSAYQAADSDLTTWATVTPSANGKSLVSAATYATMRGLLDLEAGTDFYSIAAADAAFLENAQLDDTKGNGDTTYIWSADKIYDQLALKVTTTDINTAAKLESVAGLGAYASDILAATTEGNFKAIVNLEPGVDVLALNGDGGSLTNLDGGNIQNESINDDAINWSDVTSSDMTFDVDTVPTTAVYSGTTSLEETTAANDSGAYIIGVFDEFDNSDATNVQGVLNDLDAAIVAAGGGDITAVGPGYDTGGAFTDGVASTGSTMFIWEGTSVDANEFIVNAPSANPGADITVTFPSTTGTLLNNVVEDTTPQLGGDLDLNSKNIDFPTTANISDCLDENDMSSDSAVALATQRSIKAYVDTQIATQIANIVEDTTPQLGGALDTNNKYILMTAAPSDAAPGGGADVRSVTVDEAPNAVGDCMTIAADFHYEMANANSTVQTRCNALALETGTGTKLVLFRGEMRQDVWNWSEGWIYLDETDGDLTQSPPTDTGDMTQIVGYAMSTDTMYFNPSGWYTLHD